MAPFSRLIVATLSDVERKVSLDFSVLAHIVGSSEYDRARLRQGLLKSNFLRGPFVRIPSRSQVCSPKEWNNQPLRFVTLPNEILKMILGYLDPIWLFQAEAAHPQIRTLLASLNSTWYENLPPALFAEPEHFQDEDHIARQSVQEFSSLQLATSDARPSSLSGTRYYWDQSGFQQGLIVLPKINNMSELSMNVEWSCNLHHPTDTRNYPLIRSHGDSIRIRNLALGGPFQPEIDYRRELAGWLHYGKRCQICALPFHQVYRPHQIDFGVLFCRECHKEYTLTNAQVQELPGLDKLISKSTDPQWSHHRRSVSQIQWRPLVDAVLREQLGIDFETALAKQKYLIHLGATLTASRRPTEKNRTRLRHEIVLIAKRIWDFGSGNLLVNRMISFARSTFAPTDTLQCFLFPPRSLDESLLHLPFDDSESWLEDPTRLLRSRDIFNRTSTWKNQAAMEMITKLCDWSSINYRQPGYGGTVTTWIAAADRYHIQRMEQTVSADFAIEKLKGTNLAFYGQNATLTGQGQLQRKQVGFERMGVILAKLKILPVGPERKEVPNKKDRNNEELKVTEQVLSDHELKMAKEFYFKKLLRACCVGCPRTGFLAFPPGYIGMVKHFREAHRRKYWTTNNWVVVG